MPENISDWIAIWAAVLSTILAAVRLWEVWKDRFRIKASLKYRSRSDQGNEVIIQNLSRDPVILEYWELLFETRRWPFKWLWTTRKLSQLACPDEYWEEVRIAPYSSKRLVFADENHFSLSSKRLRGKPIFIRLMLAGRRPLLVRLKA